MSLIECELDICCKFINPNFIYNRFDLWKLDPEKEIVKCYCYKNKNTLVYFEVLYIAKKAQMGIWLTDISFQDLKNIIEEIFRKEKFINFIYLQKSLNPIGVYKKSNHFSVRLPEGNEHIDDRISSKSRSTIKRKLKKLEEKYGNAKFIKVPALSDQAKQLWDFYFLTKAKTHKTSYNMTYREYIYIYIMCRIYTLYYWENKNKLDL